MLRSYLSRLSPRRRAFLSLGLWAIVAVVAALLMVQFVARSFVVHGISMEPSLQAGDVVFTSKLPYTWNRLTGGQHIPQRGALVVFKNPFYSQGDPDMYIIKRVIGLPGDRVKVDDGRIIVFPAEGLGPAINPDDDIRGPQGPTSGSVDRIVPDGELFVVGDNRSGNSSLDSRNGMSTVPLREIHGTVMLRFWPLNAIRFF